MKLNKGFSLVELLIVITIIGVFATIVLTTVSNSRAKAFDSRVKQQLSQFRTGAELYFGNQIPVSYGPVSSLCNYGMFADSSASNGSLAAMIDSNNLPIGTTVVCGSNGTSYAVKASLYSGNEYWCVDSKGNSKLESGSVGSSVTYCP